MDSLLKDLRYSVRTLSRSSVATVVAVLSLALAIGANTTILALVHKKSKRQQIPQPLPDQVTTGTETGLPSSNIRLRMLQAIKASRCWDSKERDRREEPRICLYLKKVFSTRPC